MARSDDKQKSVKRPVRTRSRLRRIAKVVGIVLATPIVLALVVLAIVHTGPAQHWIRAQIQQRVTERLYGSLTVGELDFALFGDVALRKVVILDESGSEIVALDSLELSLDWGSLFEGAPVIDRVALDGLRLALAQDEKGVLNLQRLVKPRPPEPPSDKPKEKKKTRIQVRQLHIGGVNLSLEKADGTRIALQDFGLDASIDATPATLTALVEIQRITAGLVLEQKKDGLTVEVSGFETGLSVALEGGAGSLSIAPTKAHVEIAQRGTPVREADLDLKGITVQIEPGQLAATLDKLMVGAVVLRSLEVRGGIDDGGLAGEQKVQLLGFHVDAKRANGLLGRQLLASDIDIETEISGPPERIDIKTTVNTAGGKLALAGTLDASNASKPVFDLALTGTELAAGKLVISDKLPPVEVSRIHLGVRGVGASRADAEVDLGLTIGKTTVDRYTLDGVQLAARFDGGVLHVDPLEIDAYGHKLIVRGLIDLVQKTVAVRLTMDGDVGATLDRLRGAGLNVKPRLPRGAVRLHEGVITVDVEGDLEGLLRADVGINSFAIAGGTIAANVHAELLRNVDAGPDDKKIELQALEGIVELRGLGLKQLLALRGKKLDGLTGTVSGKVTIEDVPGEPRVTYHLEARTQAHDSPRMKLHAPTAVATARGQASKTDLSLNLTVVGHDGAKREELLTAEVAAPLVIADDHRGIAPYRPLHVELTVPKRKLTEISAYLPERLLVDKKTGKPRKIPDGTIQAHVEIEGTGARPQGTLAVDVAVPALDDRTHRLKLDGTIGGQGAAVAVAIDLTAWLDAKSEPALEGKARVELSRSPLVAGPRQLAWSVDLGLKPQNLADLPLPPEKIAGLSGKLGANIKLQGNRSDLAGQVQAKFDDVVRDGKGPFSGQLTVDIKPEHTVLDVDLDVSQTPVLRVDGTVARPGTGLLAALRDKTPGKSTLDKLGTPALDVTIDVVNHPIKTHASLKPALAQLPGNLAGSIHVRGNVKTPTASGDLAYQDFETLSGRQGRVGVTIDATAEHIGAHVKVGEPASPDAQAPIDIFVGTPRPAIHSYLAAKKCYAAAPQGAPTPAESSGGEPADTSTAEPTCPDDAKLPIDARIRAADVELKDLVPAFALKGKKMEVGGKLTWTLDGKVILDPKPHYGDLGGERVRLPPISPDTKLDGALSLKQGSVTLPGTSRRFHDINVGLRHEAAYLYIDAIGARESDLERKNRKLDIDGYVSLKYFKPTQLRLNLKSDHWLVFGHKIVGPPDAPRGSLTMNATVEGFFDNTVKTVDVLVHDLEVLIPNRFRRAHQPEQASQGDVIFLDETPLGPGKLPVSPKALEKNAEDPFAHERPAPAKDEPARGFDIHVRIPEPIHILQFPMNLHAFGRIDVRRRESGNDIHGELF
ncbi:MAG: AsmA family protein, partial [Deltaproteobacteria bacterium]|nr:AsmA family protein [Deltaproteobacteria bacterium]